MNNIHSFQNFRQFSNLCSQIRFKKRHTSLFSGICREIRTKIHQQFSEKIAKFDIKNEKSEIHYCTIIVVFIREKMLTIFG